MATLLEELKSVLNDELQYYMELNIISKEKKNVIVANNIEDLSKINAVENMLVSRIQKLGIKRDEIVQDMAIVLNKNKDTITIMDIALAMKDESDKEELTKLVDDIVNEVDELKQQNVINKELIELSQEYIQFTMNVIQTTMYSEDNNYDKNKIVETKSKFDSKS